MPIQGMGWELDAVYTTGQAARKATSGGYAWGKRAHEVETVPDADDGDVRCSLNEACQAACCQDKEQQAKVATWVMPAQQYLSCLAPSRQLGNWLMSGQLGNVWLPSCACTARAD